MVNQLEHFNNIIVMQTFSKAWGSAAVRLGIAYAAKEIIDIFNKVKYPYNINILTQQYAIDALNKHKEVADWVATIIANRQVLIDDLKTLRCVQRIYATDSNFVLVRVDDADKIYNFLCDKGIIVRNRNRVEKCLGCLRFTIGSADENSQLINALKNYEQQ